MWRLILILALLFPIGLGAEALPTGRIKVRAYSEEMGLRSQNIQAVAQDRDGILYVGTAAGLFRFGGSRFALIPLREDIEAPSVLSLAPHPEGGLWVGTNSGLALVRGQSIQWATMAGTANNLSVSVMALDGGGRVWFPNRRGMFRQVGPTHFEVDPATTGWAKDGLALAQSPQGTGIVALQGTRVLHRLLPEGTWHSLPVSVPFPDQLLLDAQGALLLFHGRRIQVMEPGAKAFRPFGQDLPAMPADNGRAYPDRQGGLWVPTVEGIVRLSNGPPVWWDRRRGLPDQGVFFTFVDQEGDLWCGGVGLYRVLGNRWFRAFDTGDGLAGNVIWAVFRTRGGRLLVGTQVGLSELAGGRFRTVPGTEGLNVSQILQDWSGTVWIATRGGGLLHMPETGRKALPVRAFGDPFPGRMALAGDGTLFVNGSRAGLVRLSPRGAAEPAVTALPVPTSPSGGVGVNRIAVDGAGRLWATVWYGLLLLEGDRWRTFTVRDGLRMDGVQDVTFAPDGDLWIRYEEPIGVSRMRFQEGRLQPVEQLSSDRGLPSSLVYGVFPESGGDFWMLTDRGIVRRYREHPTNLTILDGLPTNDCDEDAFWKDADGTVWIGLSNGLVRVDGQEMPRKVPPPVARLVGMTDPLRSWMLPSERPPETYSIREATLTFRFGTRSFRHEGAARFQVRLDGLEDDWRVAESGLANYPKLREGQYRFRVRAARPGEDWGPEATYTFRVLPPWYRTWWAYGGEGLLLVVTVLLGVRLRLRAITRQRDLLEAQVRARTQEIQQAREALEVANLNLKAQSLTDPLTGLHNRRYLQEALPQDVHKVIHLHRFARRNDRRGDHSNPDLVFLLVDLDHFKAVNDTHGHHAGDEVLRETALVLQEAMRDTDAIVRWGGEEFLVVARETNRSEGARMAERIRLMVAEHAFTVDGTTLQVTCSVGYAPFPLCSEAPEGDWERAVDLADAGLYLAKRSGRNGWVGVSEVHQDSGVIWSSFQLKADHEAHRLVLETSFPRLSY